VEERDDLCRFGVVEPDAHLHVRHNLYRFLQACDESSLHADSAGVRIRQHGTA
jgi:hypothetical protein